MPARTVSRIIARAGLPRLTDLDPMTGERIRASKTTAVRYERERPGELVHMDVKKLGRIPDGDGWKAHGRGAGSILRDRGAKVGFDHVHSVVDDHCGRRTPRSRPTRRARPAPRSSRERSGTAPRTASPASSGSSPTTPGHRWSLREVCTAHGIQHEFIKPHCPWQDGEVERFNRTLRTEWACRQPFTSNDERTAALDPWLEHYNTGRRHSALGGQPLNGRLQPTS